MPRDPILQDRPQGVYGPRTVEVPSRQCLLLWRGSNGHRAGGVAGFLHSSVGTSQLPRTGRKDPLSSPYPGFPRSLRTGREESKSEWTSTTSLVSWGCTALDPSGVGWGTWPGRSPTGSSPPPGTPKWSRPVHETPMGETDERPGYVPTPCPLTWSRESPERALLPSPHLGPRRTRSALHETDSGTSRMPSTFPTRRGPVPRGRMSFGPRNEDVRRETDLARGDRPGPEKERDVGRGSDPTDGPVRAPVSLRVRRRSVLETVRGSWNRGGRFIGGPGTHGTEEPSTPGACFDGSTPPPLRGPDTTQAPGTATGHPRDTVVVRGTALEPLRGVGVDREFL